MLTWEEIEKMTDEELIAKSNTLATQVLGKFLLIQAVKWGLIIGVGIVGRKLIERAKS